MLEASIQLARELALVGAARRFVDQTVTEWGLDPIRNAVLHARTDSG